ncbi:uncharacterized protein LOC126405615 [Epinephelus moara]|uniref:uncharacterized protein LOC126405615 n=1 Tax=Epinephelus moara TaxID=300413 RepID=UPI00214E7BCB|nr:uncharacterized protein LOC126405615 [Epinephelus moara]
MSFSSGVRTQHVFGWVSIIWFMSAVCIIVSESVELQTISQIAAQCGNNVTLKCDAVSSHQLDIRSFEWLARDKSVCQNGHGQPDRKVLCERGDHSLTLTLLNVMPDDQGTYLCKLRSTSGSGSKNTVVTVQDCLGSVGSSINESYAECWFTEVYPDSTVHWFQGDVNLTDLAVTQEAVDNQQYNYVSSKIVVQKGNLSQPYECSLWIPSTGKYLSNQQLHMVQKLVVNSSENMVKLQWICMIVGIMMVKFMA